MEIFAVPPSDLEYESPMCSTATTNRLKYALVVTVEMSTRDDECGPQQLFDIVRLEPQYNEPFHDWSPLCIRIVCTKGICSQLKTWLTSRLILSRH